MSWWDIGDNVIGDAPADIMNHTLSEISRRRENQKQFKLTFQELLDGFVSALRKIDYSKRYSFWKVIARLETGHAVVSTGESTDEQLVSALCLAFKEIEKEYQQRFEREPRLNELLQTFLFVIGYKPERFISDIKGIKLKEIAAE